MLILNIQYFISKYIFINTIIINGLKIYYKGTKYYLFVFQYKFVNIFFSVVYMMYVSKVKSRYGVQGVHGVWVPC